MAIKKHVFIIGSKGIPASYGGFEAFVEKLTKYHQDTDIQYHVACAVDSLRDVAPEFYYNGAHCFNIEWRKLGSAKAIFYDIDALNKAISYVRKNNIQQPVFYILACRIGICVKAYKEKIESLGGKFYVNPDGHEWKRGKWSAPVRKYWKFSEKHMVKYADLLICDSKEIEKYMRHEYRLYNPQTIYISYGAEIKQSRLSDTDTLWLEWLEQNMAMPDAYYLAVGRFVPENNYETMISEFMRSNTKRDLLIITTVNEKLSKKLERRLGYKKDKRIKFPGAVYNGELLKKIRENAYGYIHGHEVGGTNPSLLEALASTELNLLLNVGFNREAGGNAALYWEKENQGLSDLIELAEKLNADEIGEYGKKAKERIAAEYNCVSIAGQYEMLFIK